MYYFSANTAVEAVESTVNTGSNWFTAVVVILAVGLAFLAFHVRNTKWKGKSSKHGRK